VGRALAAAFEDDPVWRWMTPDWPDWVDRAAPWFAGVARVQPRGHGEVLVDDEVRGAAIWAPPERWRSSAGEAVRLAVPSIRLFRRQMGRAVRLLGTLEGRHPPDPSHWYLAILGTDPAHQGQGVGSALVRAVTERCDAEGLPAYLESSKHENVAFYARHGFEVQERIEVRDGPPMWLMWREPS
jgi:ribosomal protein S18 acetylase RimI-like enzyme